MKKVFILILCIMYLRSPILCLQIIIPHDFNDKRLVALLPEKFQFITKIIYSDDQIDRLCNDLYNDSVPRLKDSQAKRWKNSMKAKIHTGLTTNKFTAYFIGKLYSSYHDEIEYITYKEYVDRLQEHERDAETDRFVRKLRTNSLFIEDALQNIVAEYPHFFSQGELEGLHRRYLSLGLHEPNLQTFFIHAFKERLNQLS